MGNRLRDITVLVSACAYQFMPGLVDCLKNNGERNVRIVGTDMNYDETVLQMVDVFYQVPKAKDPSYCNIVLDICKKEKVDIVLPTMSAELIPLLNNKQRFEEAGIRISISNRESIETTNNKLRFYEFMKDNGLPMVDFYRVHNVDEMKEAFIKLRYPEKAVCVKSLESSGSRGIRIIDPSKSRFDILFNEKPNSFYISYDELIEILSEKDKMPEMVAMEALPGEEFSVDLVADKGEVLYMCARQSNTIIASIPQVATLFEEKKAYEICKKVVRLLRLDGNADFDFRYNIQGDPILMEVNPRIAATMAIFKAGGMNLPYLRIKQLLGEKLPKGRIEYGIRMVRRYIDMFTANNCN
ncbi:MAG: ATP-grasp domain-containing protein [Erysipelotrichaceae bacterium]|nr:ATP-grasp domain-containing protein [Erysipelotrichaceae bacterium]